MYSSKISSKDIAAVELALGEPLQWWPVDEFSDINDSFKHKYNTDGELVEALTDSEQKFIDHARIRCQLDAMYWLERCAYVRRDDVRGGEGLIELWESQKVILAHIAHVEEEMWASYDRQVAAGFDDSMIRVAGILIALLKARQLGATALILLLLLHRFIFWTNLREVFASADEKKTTEAYE